MNAAAPAPSTAHAVRLAIVDRSQRCACCGRWMLAGAEAVRLAHGVLTHVGCGAELAGPGGR